VPVFNKEKFLDDCLLSVREQTLRNIEIVCINDGSTDRSGEILAAHKRTDERIRLFESSSNRGAGASRNTGIEMARGQYIRFVDADDLIPSASSEAMYRRAVKSSADVVRGSLALFRGHNSHAPHLFVTVPDKETTTFRDESILWVPWWHTSYLISRGLIRDRNLRYPSLVQGEDPVFLASVLVNAERISLLEEVVYLYRKYPKSTGSGQATFESVTALLAHAQIVKSMFYSHAPETWHSGYGPFLLNDVKLVVKRAHLTEPELATLTSRAAAIWQENPPLSLL